MTGPENLNHVWRDVPGHSPAKVCVLDTGATIGPEEAAMLCALHSRSTGGIISHLEALAKRGAKKFMQDVYVGYGHESVGDNGSIWVFVEGVSMLAAKAIQGWPLYNGQESSTRFIEFTKQPLVNPCENEAGEQILETWRSFYLRGVELLPKILEERHPVGEGEKTKNYEKAIKARALDIMGAFLPAGTSTNVAWYMPIRQFGNELLVLRNHPLLEVRMIAQATEEALREKFPSSFSGKHYRETEIYYAGIGEELAYFSPESFPSDFTADLTGINRELLGQYRKAFETRPNNKTPLPYAVEDAGTALFEWLSDYRSYRDIQRQRSAAQRAPLLTLDRKFEYWYLEQMPEFLREEATDLIGKQEGLIKRLKTSPEIRQYYIAMGYKVPFRMVGGLRALTWIVEIRTTRFVHPTLSRRTLQMADALTRTLGKYGYKVFIDREPGRFDVGRGKQDIILKK
jgi:thymidylate synthase ThyX